MKLDFNYTGKTLLKNWWKIVKSNFQSVQTIFNTHQTSPVIDHPDKSVTEVKLADKAVSAAKLNDSAVTTSKIADSAVKTSKIGGGAVTAEKLIDGAVTSAKIGNKAVETQHIADLAVGVEQIKNLSITSEKLSSDLQNHMSSVPEIKAALDEEKNTREAADAEINLKIDDAADSLAAEIAAREAGDNALGEEIDMLRYTKMNCYDFGEISNGTAEREFMDVSTGVPDSGDFVRFSVKADCTAVALPVTLYGPSVSPKIEAYYDFKAGHRYLAVVTKKASSTVSTTTGPKPIYTAVNGSAQVVCDNGVFSAAGGADMKQIQYIMNTMRSERERVDELYAMLGHMVVDGGVFGMGDVKYAIDGSAFTTDKPAFIVDCGDFGERIILSAIENNSVLNGGTY